jgi:hypothetical protein
MVDLFNVNKKEELAYEHPNTLLSHALERVV